MTRLNRLAAVPLALIAFAVLPACSNAQEARLTTGFHPASIQPETTISISAQGAVQRAPDIAYITTGVTTEAKTAEAALAENASRMNALMAVLKEAGIAERDIQTSNFSLYPTYIYPENQTPRITGYNASNQVTVRVRALDRLGSILDTVVRAGGNTFGGLSFGLDDETEARNEARRLAMKEAMARAELYAGAAGLKVRRVVTISEGGGWSPQPMPMMAMKASADAAFEAPSPVAGGEVGYTADVSVLFELGR
jgi:uncharacterized protein YggE